MILDIFFFILALLMVILLSFIPIAVDIIKTKVKYQFIKNRWKDALDAGWAPLRLPEFGYHVYDKKSQLCIYCGTKNVNSEECVECPVD